MINIVLELREKWIFLFVSQKSKQMGRNWGLNKYSIPAFFFFSSILFIFKRKNCLKTEFIKKHIKVFCLEKDKKENTFFLCELSFLRQSVCWNNLMIQNYLKLFKLQLSCDFCCLFTAQQPTFPRGSLGQLLSCCCLQRSHSPPWCKLLASWGRWWSTCSRQRKTASSPCPSSLVLQRALSASTAPSGLILP